MFSFRCHSERSFAPTRTQTFGNIRISYSGQLSIVLHSRTSTSNNLRRNVFSENFCVGEKITYIETAKNVCDQNFKSRNIRMRRGNFLLAHASCRLHVLFYFLLLLSASLTLSMHLYMVYLTHMSVCLRSGTFCLLLNMPLMCE